jgi:hypothetical protein
MGGALGQELSTTSHYEAVAELVREEDVAESVVCGPDPERHLDQIRAFEQAGFDHVFVHQIGPTRAASCASTPRGSSRRSRRVWRDSTRAGRDGRSEARTQGAFVSGRYGRD